MTFLAWLVRAIILTIIINMIFRLLTGGRPSSGQRRSAGPRPTAPPRQTERQGGTLVRDPHCGTYLPESRAIRVGSGSSAVYFCSDACRNAHAAGQAGRDAAAS
jgi:hypothetical protein